MPPIQRKAASAALTREQCRAVDQYAIEQLGIPGVVLMENAGRNAADLIEAWMRQLARGVRKRTSFEQTGRMPVPHQEMPVPHEVCVICGKGNNGGDGFVIARQLVNRGYRVSVDLAAEPASLTGDAAVNHDIARRMEIPIHELDGGQVRASVLERWRRAAVVVDALLGTGFSGEVREPLAGIINAINALTDRAALQPRPLIVAVDVPSGLDADTGMAAGPAVKAHRTITFLAPKTGYQKKTARGYLGRVTVVDIGAPVELILERLGISTGVGPASCRL
jgi:NAD(P)H-hydrate epimerase